MESLFFFFLFLSPCFYPPGEKLFRPGTSNFSIQANNIEEIALGLDLWRFQFARERGTECSKQRRAGSSGETEWEGPRREHMDGKGNERGNEKERRPRKQVSWRTRRPTADRRPRSLTQILQTTKHRPSSARFTIQSSFVARRSSSSLPVAPLSSLHHGPSAFAPPRGKHRNVWKILTSEASSPGSSTCMAPKTTRAGARQKREG